MIRQLAKQRLIGGLAPAQCEEAYMVMRKIDLTAQQPMSPMCSHRKASAEQRCAAVLIGAADKDHSAVERGMQVELEVFGKGSSLRRAFAASGGFAAVGTDIALRDSGEGGHIGAVMTLPNFALPKRIESFDSVLKAGFARRCKYRRHPQGETQPAHPPHRVSKLMGALKDRIVIELSVMGQTRLAPAVEQGGNGGWALGLGMIQASASAPCRLVAVSTESSGPPAIFKSSMKSKLSSSARPQATAGKYQPLGGAERRCRGTPSSAP